MYETIVKKLSEAGKSGNPEQIKEASLFFIDALSSELGKKDLAYPALFSWFISNKDILFRTGVGRPDAAQHSTGLVAQLLEKIGVVEFERISEGVEDGLWSVESGLSRNVPDVEKEEDKKELMEALEVLRLAVLHFSNLTPKKHSESLIAEYETIVKKLSEGKESGNPEQIKESIVFLSDILIHKLEKEELTYEEFSFFTFVDKNQIFRVNKKIVSDVGVIVQVTSIGMVAQMLDMIGVIKYEKISDNVHNALWNLTSSASINSPEYREKDKKDLMEALEVLQLVVS
ncbi:MAG: hypothetical protein NT098_05755 [Candidatus Parcubacteria bacterium]|nr:hypothetical protein [Candidatus Parcubacteria bacterium]